MSRVLYVVACAAPPVHDIATLVAAAQDRAFDVCLICTPTAERWLAETSPT